MKLLGLPGREPSTHAQMQALMVRLEVGQTGVELRRHGFWQTDWTDPDVVQEALAVAGLQADLVLAKSIGTLIAMLAVKDHGFAPTACVFLGTPLKRLIAEDRLGLLQAHCAAVPTLFIQQTGDIHGAYDLLAQIVSRHPLCAACEIPGDDHLYDELDLIVPLIESWVNEA